MKHGEAKTNAQNPILERPSTTMGSDVQGKRMPSKPMPRKTIKGGKQPHKHLLHKSIKHSTTGGIKKPYRYCPGLLALREIRRYQQTTDSLIQRDTHSTNLLKKFLRSIGYALEDLEPLLSRCHFQSTALAALQHQKRTEGATYNFLT